MPNSKHASRSSASSDVTADSQKRASESSSIAESTDTNPLEHFNDVTSKEEKRKSISKWLNSPQTAVLVVQQGSIDLCTAQEFKVNEVYLEEEVSVTSSAPTSPDMSLKKLGFRRRSISDTALAALKQKLLAEIEGKYDSSRMFRTHSLIQYWRRKVDGMDGARGRSTKFSESDAGKKKKVMFRRSKQIKTATRFRSKSFNEDEKQSNSPTTTKRKKSFFKEKKEVKPFIRRQRSEPACLLAVPVTQVDRKNSWGSIKEALYGMRSPILRRKHLTESASSFESIESTERLPKFKIVQVQEKFPNDRLYLDLTLEAQEKLRRCNSHQSPNMRTYRRNATLAPELEADRKHSNDDLNYGEGQGSTTRRFYVQEGAVKFSSMTSTNERYIFLFNDIMFVAKSKTASTFKLKERVRVSEIWLSQSIDDVTETTISPEKSFAIGWPTANYAAWFNSSEEKDLWYKALQRSIEEQHDKLVPKEIKIEVLNKTNPEETPSQSTTVTVTCKTDVRSVIKIVQEQCKIQPDEQNIHQLWYSNKDILPYPLVGHELPYALRMFQLRSRDENENQNEYTNILQEAENRCQFILKTAKKGGNRINLDLNNSQRKWKNPMKKSPIINWAMNKKTLKYSQSSYTETVTPGKLFGNSLSSLANDDELVPKPVQDILVQLFRRGPATTGIFRKSALQRTAKQIRQSLDAGKEENFDKTSTIVLAAVLKDFFRSLPDSLIPSSVYDNLVATKSVSDVETRVEEVKRLLQSSLAKPHYELTMKFMCVLHHIQRFSEHNNMNAYNLSVCVSPSIMNPPQTHKLDAAEQTSRTSEFVCFLIENYISIFSEVYLLGKEEEIQLNDGPGEDSDSGTDQQSDRLHQPDDTEEEKYDSEREIDLPLSPADSVFSPIKSTNLDCPFAQSDSSLCTNDSDENARTTNSSNLTIPSVGKASSSPSSPATKRRYTEKRWLDEKNLSDNSDHESSDYNEIFQRKLLRQPRNKRILSSVTTSSELIEHRRPPSLDGKTSIERKTQKKNKNENNFQIHKEGDQKVVPKKSVISQPVIQHFATEYSASPNVIFHSVDRRRQPAVPSYEEHIQQTKLKNRKKSIPPHKIQQVSVDDYKPCMDSFIKQCSLDHSYHINYKVEELKSMYAKGDNLNAHVTCDHLHLCQPEEVRKASLVRVEEPINVTSESSVQQALKNTPQKCEGVVVNSKNKCDPLLIKPILKQTKRSQSNTSSGERYAKHHSLRLGTPSSKMVVSTNTPKRQQVYISARKDDNNSRSFCNGESAPVEIEQREETEEASHQSPQSNSPFSLKLNSELRKNTNNAISGTRGQSLQLEKTCLTQAPKKIDQLTNNCADEKVLTARELRRTNRRLKNEVKNAFNGMCIYKNADVANNNISTSDKLNSLNKQIAWKKDEKENYFKHCKLRFSENNNVIASPADESNV